TRRRERGGSRRCVWGWWRGHARGSPRRRRGAPSRWHPAWKLPQRHVLRVLDHDRARGKVAETLAPTVDEEGHQADAVRVREEVDDPDHVADPRLHERHRLPAVTDSAQTEDSLADGLSRPEGLACQE